MGNMITWRPITSRLSRVSLASLASSECTNSTNANGFGILTAHKHSHEMTL